MNGEGGALSSSSGRAIERGRAYHHENHGRVEVTDIWHGTQWVDSVDSTNDTGATVVRFMPAEGDNWSDELCESLATFLEAID